MSATWTCTCGKTFSDYGTLQGDKIRCPACGFVLGEALPSRYKPPTTFRAQAPTPRTVLACPDVAVQAAEPKPRSPSATDDPPPKEVDIRKPVGDRRILVGALLLAFGSLALPLYCLYFPGSAFLAREAQADAASAHLNGPLTEACEAYHQNHGAYPAKLETLLEVDENHVVYLDRPESLIDPWGNRYQYDPKGPKNKGQKPDIWTVRANGKEIGNWPKGR
jgi:hypothetical protein